jgi:hypothetical protein
LCTTKVTHQPTARHTLKKADLCAGALQDDRMANNELVVFDTDVRRGLRATIAGLIQEDKRKMFLTGPAGTGKSFNLALLVTELRSAGNVVVYVPTMNNVLRDAGNLLDELLHALKRPEVAQRPELHAVCQRASQIPRILTSDSIFKRVKPNDIDEAFRDARDTCAAIGIRFVVVIDQDNRLWKEISNDVSYISLDSLITVLPGQWRT